MGGDAALQKKKRFLRNLPKIIAQGEPGKYVVRGSNE